MNIRPCISPSQNRSLSAESASHIVGKAYIHLRLGGAEVAAVTHTGYSPILLAFKIGWLNEWKTCLDRCAMDPDALYEQED